MRQARGKLSQRSEPPRVLPDSQPQASEQEQFVVNVLGVECNASLAGQLAVRGHAGVMRGVAFSPDGRLVAAAGDDGTILILERNPLDVDPRAIDWEPGEESRINVIRDRRHNPAVTWLLCRWKGDIFDCGG